jgi:DNA-directed RNA polymerase alpha subunit
MTVNKNLKRTIRRRMRRTGESYTAARRHFLGPKESHMTRQATHMDEAILGLSIETLELTLKTNRALKRQGIERIGQLVEKVAAGMDDAGFEREESAVEVREVLASRGL